jgi:hypothetical protein
MQHDGVVLAAIALHSGVSCTNDRARVLLWLHLCVYDAVYRQLKARQRPLARHLHHLHLCLTSESVY